MQMINNITIPNEQIETLCREFHVRELSLFGSVLGDSFGPESDIDILVDFNIDAHIGYIELFRLQRLLGNAFERSVDLVPKGGLKPYIKDSIISQAIPIYGKKL